MLIRPRLHPVLAVVAGRYTDYPLEHPPKGNGAGIPKLQGNILEIIACSRQQIFRPLHAQLGQEVHEFHIKFLFEQMAGIFARDLKPVAKMLQR
ncbi:hypothetical protein D3C76_1629350 [compost metagenome]